MLNFYSKKCRAGSTEDVIIDPYMQPAGSALKVSAVAATINRNLQTVLDLLFFLLLILLRSICHQVSNQADKFDLLAIILLFCRCFVRSLLE